MTDLARREFLGGAAALAGSAMLARAAHAAGPLTVTIYGGRWEKFWREAMVPAFEKETGGKVTLDVGLSKAFDSLDATLRLAAQTGMATDIQNFASGGSSGGIKGYSHLQTPWTPRDKLIFAASVIGGRPYRFVALAFAPARSSIVTSSASSPCTAQCSAVVPSTPGALTSTLPRNCVRTAL